LINQWANVRCGKQIKIHYEGRRYIAVHLIGP